MYLEHAKDDGKDVRVGTWLRSWLAPCAQVPVADQIGLDKTIPKEAVISPLPEWRRGVVLRLALKAVCEVDRVGKIHGAGFDERFENLEKFILIRIVDLSFAHREDIGGDDLVDHMAPETTHGLSFGDDNDILVYIKVSRAHPRPLDMSSEVFRTKAQLDDSQDASNARHP